MAVGLPCFCLSFSRNVGKVTNIALQSEKLCFLSLVLYECYRSRVSYQYSRSRRLRTLQHLVCIAAECTSLSTDYTFNMDEIQIVFALAVLYVTYRWWSRPGSSAPGSTTSPSSSQSTPNERLNNLARDFIPPSHLAQVQAMFPQLNEREIKWEFVRTGRVRNVEQVVQFFLDSPPSAVSNDFTRVNDQNELL